MFNWLKQATGAIGNLFNQGSRYVGNTFNNANRQRQQWQQQVQRQAPQVQRQVQQQFQQVQRQIPKPPPTPQVDFSAVIANLQKLRSQPQVQRMAQAANPVNQFKQQANALQKQVINPLNQFGQNQVNRAMGGIKVAQNANQQALQNPIVKTALNVPFSNPVSAYNALSNPRKTFNDTRGAREMFFGKTGELANTVKSLPAGINVLALAPYEIAGQKLGIKPLEQRAKKLRLQQYADYAKQSQQGINPVGSQQQRDIDAGGVKGLKAFTGTMLNKGAGAGLEIAPVVTGAAVTAPLKSTLLKGGTLGAVGNVGYSGVSGYYSPNRSAQEKALQFVTDVAGGYGGELLGYGGSKAIQRIASKPVAKGFTGNLIDQANTRFRQGQINEKQYRAFLVDNFEQQFKRKPMPIEIDGYIDVAKNSYNRPYTEAIRARTLAQASGQPQLPVQAQRIAQDTPQVGKTPKGNEGIYPKSYENFVNKNRESAKPFDYDLMASIGSTPEVRGDKVKVYRMVSGGGGKLQPNDNVSIYDFRKLSPEVQRKMGVQDVVANKKSKMVEQWINKDELYQAETGTQIYRPTTPAQVGKTGKPIYELAPKPSKTPEVSDAKLPIKQSGIGKTLEKSGVDIYDDIPGYVPVKNKALLNISENRVANNEQEVIASIVNRQSNQPVTPQMNSDAVYLLNKLLKEGRDEEALAIAKATAKNATSAGRAVQILSRLQQTTPSGALVKAQKIVNEVNAKAGKQVASLDAVKQKDIIALANEVQKHKVGTREWEVSAGKLLKYMENLKPVGTGTKVGMIQTMAQLLNPKTAIRNIVGNVGMNVGEDVASVPAALLDRIVSKGTGIRTTTISNPIVGIKGAAKGIKYGIEDTNLGIKTLGGASKFDVRPDVFKKGVMKKLQTALGYELGVPDKAFYQSAFDKTLDSVMRANKTKTPTQEMLDIANTEALYATFQNNSKIAQGLQKAKSILNAGQEFGAGDFIIKYPKTPGNIVSTGLDYSPVGMAKGIASLAQNFSKMTPAIQREAVRNIGRSITGTGAIALGYTLAKNGIITGRKDADKDIAALDREQGIGPFSFNVTALQRFVKGEDTKPRPGDVVANYDWLQPAAIQLSMGANAVINAGKGTDNKLGDLAESIGDSTNTIIEQPVLQGISQFVNNMNTKQGGGLGKALSGVVSGIPSSFVPGSVNQLGQMFDNTARNTYSPRTDFFLPTGEMFNKTIARIPVLRERLQPSVTTLGQPREQYQDGGNNIFNVFFNPAFIKRIKDNEVYDLVKDIQDRSGETQQAPRVVDKKIKINGQDKQLTPDEYTRYQTYVGQKTNQAFSQLAKDPKFLQLSDADKASYMAKKMTAINAAAKAELFGNQDIGSDAQDVIGGRLGYETAEDKRNRNRKPKVAKAPKAKKPKKGRTARARKGRAVRVAKVPSVRISAPRKIAVGKVAKLRAPRIKYPKLAKSSKMPKIKV